MEGVEKSPETLVTSTPYTIHIMAIVGFIALVRYSRIAEKTNKTKGLPMTFKLDPYALNQWYQPYHSEQNMCDSNPLDHDSHVDAYWEEQDRKEEEALNKAQEYAESINAPLKIDSVVLKLYGYNKYIIDYSKLDPLLREQGIEEGTEAYNLACDILEDRLDGWKHHNREHVR
jgi:hypothetical protein